jgi:hypothetical protein
MKKENISDALNNIDFDMVEDVYESAKANEGLNHLDPDLIEKHIEQKEKLRQKKQKTKGIWLRFGAIAACFVLVLSAVIAIPMLQKANLPDVPTWDTAQYSAEDIAKLFDSMRYDGVATNA